MSHDAPPALRIDRAVVRAPVAQGLATGHVPRDVPHLARFLMDAVAPDGERAHKLLDRLTLDVLPGERMVLLGEEGCGKTTLARACARTVDLDAGAIEVGGLGLTTRRRADALQVRRRLQVVFDDPEACLDPRCTIADSLREAFDALGLGRDGTAFESTADRALARARFPAEARGTRARDLPAGLRARAALARALLPGPQVVVVDEPSARLDPLARASLLEALIGLTPTGAAPGDRAALLALTHRPDVARALAQRVGVLYLGALVELGSVELLDTPVHPYARGFLASAPQRARPASARAIAGELPSVAERPAGCAFHPRCPDAIARCATERPALLPATRDGTRSVACHVVHQAAAP